jgi:gamma-glutamyl-gamma-aminobutyrate hydrolase PuuD
MKPIIGIVARKETSNDKVPFLSNAVPYDYIRVLDKANATYIGIITNEQYDLIDERILRLCDGILIPGGAEIKPYHNRIIKYAYEQSAEFRWF